MLNSRNSSKCLKQVCNMPFDILLTVSGLKICALLPDTSTSALSSVVISRLWWSLSQMFSALFKERYEIDSKVQKIYVFNTYRKWAIWKTINFVLPLSGTLMRRAGCRDDLSCEGVKVSGFLSKALTRLFWPKYRRHEKLGSLWVRVPNSSIVEILESSDGFEFLRL